MHYSPFCPLLVCSKRKTLSTFGQIFHIITSEKLNLFLPFFIFFTPITHFFAKIPSFFLVFFQIFPIFASLFLLAIPANG